MRWRICLSDRIFLNQTVNGSSTGTAIDDDDDDDDVVVIEYTRFAEA